MFDKCAMHVTPPSWPCCAMVVLAKCPICISILGEHFAPIGTPHRACAVKATSQSTPLAHICCWNVSFEVTKWQGGTHKSWLNSCSTLVASSYYTTTQYELTKGCTHGTRGMHMLCAPYFYDFVSRNVNFKGAWLGRGTNDKHKHGAPHLSSMPTPPMTYTKPPCSCEV